MKIRFEKSSLLAAITPAMGSVSNKNTLASIEGLLIETEGENTCIISSYDLEKGINCRVEAKIEEPGSYVIRADKLYQIIRAMPEKEILLEVDRRNVTHISSGRSKYELHAIKGEDFPNLPELTVEDGISVKQKDLREMMIKTMFAIAQNDRRPALNGEYFCIEKGTITLVSCDTFRLAVMKKSCDIGGEGEIDYKFILPGKSVSELGKLLSDSDDPIYIRSMRKHVVFKIGQMFFFSRVIEEEYIDYERFIPKNNKIFVKINRDEFEASLTRALLVTEDTNMGQPKSNLRCSFGDSYLRLSSISTNGSFNDEVSVEKEGDDIDIGFNCRYLIDAVKAASECENIKLSLSTPLMSMLMQPDEDCDTDFIFLVTPVRIKD